MGQGEGNSAVPSGGGGGNIAEFPWDPWGGGPGGGGKSKVTVSDHGWCLMCQCRPLYVHVSHKCAGPWGGFIDAKVGGWG